MLRKPALLIAALLLGITGSIFCLRAWSQQQGDPALTGDPRAYARAGGLLRTPAGMIPADPFSDGPGRVGVDDALALVGESLAVATSRLGQPDVVMSSKKLTVILWWNAVITDSTAGDQPPAYHLRADLAPGGARITRVACIGARLAEIHDSSR